MKRAGARGSSPVRRLGVLTLRILGVALLGFVLWQVNWRDNVHLQDGTVLRGEIVGELPAVWTEESVVTFLAADEAEPAEIELSELATEDIAGSAVPLVNEGLIRIVSRSDKWLMLLVLLAFGFTTHFGVWRWWLLLRGQGIRTSFWIAHKLTFIGFFFNNVVPGATGGDLIKAIYVTRHTEKRAEAVATVLADRITGIIALALIAAFVLVFRTEREEYRELAYFIFGFLGCMALGGTLFFSRRVRRILRVDHWAAKLPGGGLIKSFDEAMFTYRYHKLDVLWALLLSFANQLSIQLLMVVYASALHMTTRGGDPVPVADFMVVLPAAWIVTALPLLPGGWGVRESAFVVGFHLIGVGRTPAVALSVIGGMQMIFWSLLGGLYTILDRGALHEAEEEADHMTEEPAEHA